MGQYEHSLDEKGRLIIPAKIRDVVDAEVDGPGFVITPGPEDCLCLYTDSEWGRICEGMDRLPKGSPAFRQFQRLWYANAEPLSADRQGRILLPERLRSLVNIDREIVIAGCYDRVEIWAKVAWTAAQAEAKRSYPSQVQAFLGPGASENREESS